MELVDQHYSQSPYTPQGTRYSLYRGLGGAPGSVRTVGENSPAPGFKRRTGQPVASQLYV